MTHEVYIRNASNQKKELTFLEKLISCIKISKQFNKIYFNLTQQTIFIELELKLWKKLKILLCARKQHYLNMCFLKHSNKSIS